MTFNNYAKPYAENDLEHQNEFQKIVSEYQQKHDAKLIREEIISSVFNDYEIQFYHAELIVRVPQLLTVYQQNYEELQQCKNSNSKLFKYYKDFVAHAIDNGVVAIEEKVEQIVMKHTTTEKEGEHRIFMDIILHLIFYFVYFINLEILWWIIYNLLFRFISFSDILSKLCVGIF